MTTRLSAVLPRPPITNTTARLLADLLERAQLTEFAAADKRADDDARLEAFNPTLARQMRRREQECAA